MAITTRKDIIDDMRYRLEQIPEIATVTRWRDTDAEPFAPEECPALNIKDGTGSIEHDTSYDVHTLPISLDLHTTSAVNADEVESLLGDLAETASLNETWGGHAEGTNIERHDINIHQTGDVITSGSLDISVEYTTEKGRI